MSRIKTANKPLLCQSMPTLSTADLIARYDAVDEWRELQASTWGDCDFLSRYADQRDAYLSCACEGDPGCEWTSLRAIDRLLASR